MVQLSEYNKNNEGHQPLSEVQTIFIPARDNSSETYLRVSIVYKNQETLKKLPYLLMLPGGPGANHSYYTEYDCLYEVVNLLYYDPRGCGLSDKGDSSTYNMDNYIDDIRIIKEALQLNSMVLLGKSYGAMCALGYVLRYPKDVSKLILAAGSSTWKFIITAKSNILSRGATEQQQICQSLWKGAIKNDEHMAEYFRIMASMYSWKERNNPPVHQVTPSQRFSFEALNEGFRTQFGKFNYTKQLNNIQCPTLILVGEDDWITDPMYSKKMAAFYTCFKRIINKRHDINRFHKR
jgi:proline iminopeptidase